jgi:hypothetical protein
MAQINVSELDFATLKESIKSHFKNQSKYNDWDFDGSGLSILLDVLAYNTHYNAVTAHLALNEAFLDSAQLRGNVVSHAKLLGYVPRSTIASTAVVDVVVTAPTSNPPPFLSLDRGHKFSTTVDSSKYTFVVLEPKPAVPLNIATNTYTFTSVVLKQGTLKKMIYRVDELIENQKYEIPDTTVDSTTMRVRVNDGEEFSIYTQFSTLIGLNNSSKVYFLQENADGKYEVYFGDNNLGIKPGSNNIVEIEYVYTNGRIANGAANFQSAQAFTYIIPGSTTGATATIPVNSAVITTITNSYGGAEKESTESIRYNSPLAFITQNRAVTSEDYRAIILREFGGIDAISVWGGETDPEPNYGKVYIAIKPSGKDFLNEAEKLQITDSILKGKNVVSIEPVIIDPEFTYLEVEAFIKYNSNLTDKTTPALESYVRDIIRKYNDQNLQKFDGVFRFSQFLGSIDNSEPSILNSVARPYMFKWITPKPNGLTNSFTLDFPVPTYTTQSTTAVLSSSGFMMGGLEHFFGDEPIAGTTDRNVYIYRVVEGNRKKIANAGRIYSSAGRVVLNRFTVDYTTVNVNPPDIRIIALPNSFDIAPKRNQLLEIDQTYVTVKAEIDAIAVSGAAGTSSYTTTPRHR